MKKLLFIIGLLLLPTGVFATGSIGYVGVHDWSCFEMPTGGYSLFAVIAYPSPFPQTLGGLNVKYFTEGTERYSGQFSHSSVTLFCEEIGLTGSNCEYFTGYVLGEYSDDSNQIVCYKAATNGTYFEGLYTRQNSGSPYLSSDISDTQFFWDGTGVPSPPCASTTVLTVYPDATAGNDTISGYAARHGVNETFATIIAGAGTTSQILINNDHTPVLTSTSTTDQYSTNVRGIYTFDTSSIGATSTLVSAKLSLYGFYQDNGLGSPNLILTSSTPASNNTLVSADYGQLGSTEYSVKDYTIFNASDYNNLELNDIGLSNISTTGISAFGTMLDWDFDASFGGSWASSVSSYFRTYFSYYTGTSKDPKLTIEYCEAPSSGGTKSIIYY